MESSNEFLMPFLVQRTDDNEYVPVDDLGIETCLTLLLGLSKFQIDSSDIDWMTRINWPFFLIPISDDQFLLRDAVGLLNFERNFNIPDTDKGENFIRSLGSKSYEDLSAMRCPSIRSKDSKTIEFLPQHIGEQLAMLARFSTPIDSVLQSTTKAYAWFPNEALDESLDRLRSDYESLEELQQDVQTLGNLRTTAVSEVIEPVQQELKSRTNNTRRRLEQLRGSRNQLQQTISSLREENRRYSQRITQLRDAIRERNNAIRRYELQIESEERDIQRIERELNRSRGEAHTPEYRALRRTQNQKRSSISSIRSEIRSLNNEISRAQSTIPELQRNVQQLEREIENGQRQVRQFDSAISEQESQLQNISEINDGITSLENSIDSSFEPYIDQYQEITSGFEELTLDGSDTFAMSTDQITLLYCPLVIFGFGSSFRHVLGPTAVQLTERNLWRLRLGETEFLDELEDLASRFVEKVTSMADEPEFNRRMSRIGQSNNELGWGRTLELVRRGLKNLEDMNVLSRGQRNELKSVFKTVSERKTRGI
ncbi:MAG: hypothetical protein GF309_13340 [Candidatus Lokiarchaeota archaeon]|nr:hypothetical protein [Candidatus Lokiarchaeota archaeon]